MSRRICKAADLAAVREQHLTKLGLFNPRSSMSYCMPKVLIDLDRIEYERRLQMVPVATKLR